MANLTKKQRAGQEDIKRMIVNGHRRGVCDSSGRTVKTEQGRPIAMPRAMAPSATRHWCRHCGDWYYLSERHECTGRVA